MLLAITNTDLKDLKLRKSLNRYDKFNNQRFTSKVQNGFLLN